MKDCHFESVARSRFPPALIRNRDAKTWPNGGQAGAHTSDDRSIGVDRLLHRDYTVKANTHVTERAPGLPRSVTSHGKDIGRNQGRRKRLAFICRHGATVDENADRWRPRDVFRYAMAHGQTDAIKLFTWLNRAGL